MARLGTNKDKANVRQPALLDARAMAMVERRIHGRTLSQIAEEFNVSTDTVQRSLSRAEKMNLAERYEDYLMGRLANLALGAYEAALMENDTAVATKVLESIGLIKKPKESKGKGDEGDEDSWEAYFKVRKKRSGNENATAAPTVIEVGRTDAGRGTDSEGPPALDGEITGEVGDDSE